MSSADTPSIPAPAAPSEGTPPGGLTRDNRLPLAVLIVLGGLGAIGPLGTDLYLSALPIMTKDLHTSAAWTQLTLASFTIGLALGQLVLGALSDRFGRRGILLIGSAVMVISCVLSATAPTIELLILWRAVSGASAAAGLVVGRAVATDLTSGAATTRVFSLLGLITGIGPIVGPIIGAVILEWADWRMIFWVLTGLGAVLLVGVAVFISESLPSERRHSGGLGELMRTAGGILRHRGFLFHAAILWFGFGAIFAYISASPFVVQNMLGFSATEYTLIFGVNGLGLMVTGSLSTVLASRIRPGTLTAIGLSMLLAGSVALSVIAMTDSVSPFTVLPALFVMASSMGFVFGPATALAISGVRHASGTAFALIGCLQFALAGLAAPLVGIAGEHSIVPLAVVATTCSVIAMAALIAGRAYRSQLYAASEVTETPLRTTPTH